jgi:hypothetical protein
MSTCIGLLALGRPGVLGQGDLVVADKDLHDDERARVAPAHADELAIEFLGRAGVARHAAEADSQRGLACEREKGGKGGARLK